MDEIVLRRNTLNFIRNKGNYHLSIHRAKKRLLNSAHLFTIKESFDLSIALSHMDIGEGADELNGIIKNILNCDKAKQV